MRNILFGGMLALATIVLVPSVAAEESCPPPDNVVYAGGCGEVECNGEGGATEGVWVGQTYVVGYSMSSDPGRCSASSFCFEVLGVGVAELEYEEEPRVGPFCS